MTTKYLKNDKSVEIDIGNSSSVSITNISDENATIYVDYKNNGSWSPISGEVPLKPPPQKPWRRTRSEIGHDHIRVSATGKVDDTDIVKVEY